MRKRLPLFLAALAVAAALLLGSGTVGRWLYPQAYWEIVSGECGRQGLDPFLLYGVMYTESRCDPAARSKAGASGLMQLTPETYQWLRSLEGQEGEGDIFDPAENIHYGCAYLLLLLRQYDGDLKTALAAYNAGMGNVAKWLGDPELSQDGRALDAIPFPETERYVERVAWAREKYLLFYGGTGRPGADFLDRLVGTF